MSITNTIRKYFNRRKYYIPMQKCRICQAFPKRLEEVERLLTLSIGGRTSEHPGDTIISIFWLLLSKDGWDYSHHFIRHMQRKQEDR